MCGRYAAARRPEDLVEEFEVDQVTGQGPGEDATDAAADFNVAPTKAAPVVLERRVVTDAAGTGSDGRSDRGDPDGDDLDGDVVDGAASPGDRAASGPSSVRWLRLLTWGLVPSWAKDRSVGHRMINARAETLLDKPAYRRAALARRCLVPADGWYEWQASPTERDAKGRARKQPFFMRSATGQPVAFAGVYEFWRDPARHPDDPTAWLTTFAVVTTAAEPGLAAIHDRMPLVLPTDRWAAWLDPAVADADTVRALLEPPPPGRFEAVPVSTRVNAVAHNGPELLDPVPVDQLRGVVDPATGELIHADTPLF